MLRLGAPAQNVAGDAANAVNGVGAAANEHLTNAVNGVTDAMNGVTAAANEQANGVTNTINGMTAAANEQVNGVTNGVGATANEEVNGVTDARPKIGGPPLKLTYRVLPKFFWEGDAHNPATAWQPPGVPDSQTSQNVYRGSWLCCAVHLPVLVCMQALLSPFLFGGRGSGAGFGWAAPRRFKRIDGFWPPNGSNQMHA